LWSAAMRPGRPRASGPTASLPASLRLLAPWLIVPRSGQADPSRSSDPGDRFTKQSHRSRYSGRRVAGRRDSSGSWRPARVGRGVSRETRVASSDYRHPFGRRGDMAAPCTVRPTPMPRRPLPRAGRRTRHSRPRLPSYRTLSSTAARVARYPPTPTTARRPSPGVAGRRGRGSLR